VRQIRSDKTPAGRFRNRRSECEADISNLLNATRAYDDTVQTNVFFVMGDTATLDERN
jgi:hypothetical protein